MQSFLRELNAEKKRTLTVSAICFSLILAISVLTGAAKAMENEITIYDEGEPVKTVNTYSSDLEKLLEDQAFIKIGQHDKVNFNQVKDGKGSIEIDRAETLYIYADDEMHTVHMLSGTVEDALQEANIVLNDQDTLNCNLTDAVEDVSMVFVTRVSSYTYMTTEEVPFNVITKETETLQKGVTQIETEGQNGILTHTFVQRTENGVPVEGTEQEVSAEITTAPVDQVVLVGTYVEPPKPVVAQKPVTNRNYISELAMPADLILDENGIPVNYTNVISGRGVAYTAPQGSKTSTGRPVMAGYVAVNPNIIPYGTKLYITSADGSRVYGYAIAADTGGSCMANTILVDLFMNSEAECYAWGSRTVNIYILP